MDYTKTTLYGYSRVSTEEQQKKDNSPEFQKNSGLKLSEKMGFSNYVQFAEDHMSGITPPTQRTELSKVIDLIRDGAIQHLYVYEWSRLSRENFYSEWLRRLFIQYDVKIWEGLSTQPKDLSNPFDKLISSILSAVYTFERDNLINRIKAGIRQGYLKGRWGGALVPYGYKRLDDGLIVPDEIEVAILRQMIDLVFQGKSIREITNWLNDNNIPVKSTKTIKKGTIKRKRGGKTENVDVNMMIWRDNVVREILTSPLRKGIRISKGEKYPFPAIISESDWDLLQEQIIDNKRFNHKGNITKHFYLLKGLLYCREHNTLLLGRIKKDERTYYCSRKRKEVRIKNEPPCSLPSPNLDFIESYVWDLFVTALSDSHYVNEEFRKKLLKKQGDVTDKEKLKSKILSLKEKERELSSQEKRIVDLYVKGKIDESIYDDRYSGIKKEKKDIGTEIHFLESQFSGISEKPIWMEKIKNVSNEVKSWKSKRMTKEQKREKLLTYLSKITVGYEDNHYLLDFHFRFPMINDRVEYNDPSDPNKGYKIIPGLEVLRFKEPKKPTTKQKSVASEMV